MRRIADYVADLELNTRGANRQLKGFDRTAKDTAGVVAGRFGVVGSTLNKNLAAGAIVAGGAGLIGLAKNAAALEEGFVGVQKTTDFTDDQINNLKRSLLDLGTQLPVNTSQLIEIAKVAGQLGLADQGVAGIAKFTEAFAKLEIASDRTISGELGAQQFARFLENSGAGVESVEEIASAVTFLGNTSKLTEGQLLQTALEVSKVSRAFNLTAGDVLGLSTAFTELAVQPEVARTTTLRFFRAVEDASLAGKGLEELSKVTGLTAEQINDLRQTNPTEILTSFAKGIRTSRDNGVSLNKELKALGLNGTIVFSALSALASSTELVDQKVQGANKAIQENTALNNEVRRASQTFNAEVIKLSNSFVSLGDSLAGSGLIGFLSDVVSRLSEGVQVAGLLVRKFKEVGEFEPTRSRGQEGFSQAEINRQATLSRNIANSINRNPDFGGGIQGLINNASPLLTGGGAGAFIQRAEELGLLTDDLRQQIRDLRLVTSGANIAEPELARIRARRFAELGIATNPNAASGTNNNVQVQNDISVTSPNPQQAGNEVGRAVARDVALAVGQ